MSFFKVHKAVCFLTPDTKNDKENRAMAEKQSICLARLALESGSLFFLWLKTGSSTWVQRLQESRNDGEQERLAKA